MTIKTGRIRRKFDEALQDRIVCDNMLLMSISALNYEIQYNESVSDQKAAKYINYRKQLAKSAIDKGISKDRITEVMKTLSDERYPSYNQIIGLVALIKSYSYKYIADYLPDSDMKYKTDTELQNVNSQPVVKRNQDSIESEQQFNEICKIISGNYDITITADMQTKIRTIKESNDIILKTIKQNTNDIYKAISGKRFDNNYEKLCYILGVINRKIPNTIAQIGFTENPHPLQKPQYIQNPLPFLYNIWYNTHIAEDPKTGAFHQKTANLRGAEVCTSTKTAGK